MDQALKEKVNHVTSAKLIRAHECHWPGCKKQVTPAMWGCKPHWFKLPKKLRDEIWASYRIGQEIRGNPSDRYILAAQAVQEWINKTTIEEQKKQACSCEDGYTCTVCAAGAV